MSRPFFDTNLLVYAFGIDDRALTARRLLADGGCIAVQSLNEFARVATGKLKWRWTETAQALLSIRALCPDPVVMDIETHETAVRLAERYKLHVFDASLVAAALQGGCSIFYSEDLHDGLVVDARLTIRNPFA